MKSIKVVTTLHLDGYNLYGKEFVTSWEKYFPEHWQIDYYAEKHTPKFSNRTRVLDFNLECPEWAEFYDAVKKIETLGDKKQINRLKKALRWSFKMFTLAHALKNATTDYVIWMDADVYATKSPEPNWLNDVLGSSCLAGQVESVKGATHIETGLVLVNVKHPDLQLVIDWIEQGYLHKKILEESKPWDGFWMGKLYNSNTVDFKSIWMKIIHERTSAKTSIARPFSDPKLSWLTHRLGDRKFDDNHNGRSGRTADTELL
jgi:hypothetical protein